MNDLLLMINIVELYVWKFSNSVAAFQNCKLKWQPSIDAGLILGCDCTKVRSVMLMLMLLMNDSKQLQWLHTYFTVLPLPMTFIIGDDNIIH